MKQPVNQAANSPKPETPRHPAIELLSRYKAILQAAWALRFEMAGPKRLADEAAFLPAALSLQESPVHPAPRRFAWAIMLLFIIALLWAIFGKVDIVAVAQGRIIVSERTKLIQPLERSLISKILVKDGDIVQAGQSLIELDPTAANADKTSMQEQLKAAAMDAHRARSLLASLPTSSAIAPVGSPTGLQQTLSNKEHSTQIKQGLDAKNTLNILSPTDLTELRQQTRAEWEDIAAKLAKLQAEERRKEAEIATSRELLAKLETTVPLARQREDDFKKLSEQGFVAGHAGQDRTRERIELERDLATQRARLLEAQAALQETRNSRAAFLAETRRSLHDRQAQAELKRQQASQESAKASQREKQTVLRAPVSGQVQQLAVHTAGGIATEAQVLMVIVPQEAQVTAEVVLDNKDIGFVQSGQMAAIKLETFPFTRYGTLPAKVERVSADAVLRDKRGEGGSAESAVFPAMLQLQATHIQIDGKAVRLAPGMNVTAEIKTGQRRVIEYLLSPIQNASSESLRER